MNGAGLTVFIVIGCFRSTCQSCMNVRDIDGKSVLDRLIAKMPDAAMVSPVVTGVVVNFCWQKRPPLLVFSFSLKSSPFNLAMTYGDRCKLPQQGSG